jgi:hypothetical protein
VTIKMLPNTRKPWRHKFVQAKISCQSTTVPPGLQATAWITHYFASMPCLRNLRSPPDIQPKLCRSTHTSQYAILKQS